MPLSEQTVVHWIAVEDVGALVRLAFDRPAAFGPGPVQLGADELSFAEAAALIGEALGEEVRYEQIALGEVKDRHARGMYRWFQSYARYDPDVDEAAPPPPRPADVPAVARGRPPRPAQGRARDVGGGVTQARPAQTRQLRAHFSSARMTSRCRARVQPT